MNFSGLPGENCQINPFVELTQHATQHLKFQESVSIPFHSGLEQNYSMPPQSFRLDDLMGELQIAPPSPVADFPPSAHLAQNPWEREFQTQLQSENFQAWNEMRAQNPFPYPYENPYEENPFSYSNFQNFPSHDFQCHVPRNFDTFYPQTEYELQAEQHSEESEEIEESYENLLIEEATTEQNDKEICRPLEPIVEFDDPQKFSKYLELQVRKYQTREWEIKNPTKKLTDIPKEILIDDTKRYTYAVKNPYRNHSLPYLRGCVALNEAAWKTAALYFDEAVRQDSSKTKHWAELTYALLMYGKTIHSLFAVKELLRLDPGSLRGNIIAAHIYKLYDCDYQAYQSIFNWLKYHAEYKFLIPEDFEMNAQSEATELERHQLKAVLNLFCKAARQNPTGNIDELLQDAMSQLLEISGDFEKKKIDCVRTAIKANPEDVGKSLNLGVALFQNNNPYEALDAYMSVFQYFKYRDEHRERAININKACTGLGLVHMYLKNYREANKWFMRVIKRNYDLEIDGTGSLEVDYDVCLRSYIEVTDIVK